ncbi:MAG: hypothetical protein M1488_04250 [Gammaproteobacteria bacterium]|nr:hypothetical protein [Gammaproteobacteria bacterium]
MRLHSTIESATAGEVTLLAIVECFVSVFIYVIIALYLKTFIFYYTAIALAPLTLLRTDRSSAIAWSFGYTTRLFLSGRGLKISRFLLFWLIAIPAIRFVTLFQDVFTHPIEVLKSMPDNWRRQALCTDMFYPPEMFPLENELVRQNPFGMHLPTFSAAVTAFRKFTAQERGSMLGRMLSYLIFIVFLYPYVLSVIYRVTFKATSIIYLPFAWATSVRFIFTEGWPFQAKRILEGKLEASRRKVSNFLAIAFACKVLVIYNWVTPAAVIGKIGSEKFAKIFILNDSWPLWQDILLINVAITYCLYWMADIVLAMENKLSAGKRELTENVFIFLELFRSYTSIGVIIYLFIINLISLFGS